MAERKGSLLTKDELIKGIAEASGESNAATGRVISALPVVVMNAILNAKPKLGETVSVTIPQLGAIGVKHVGETERRNPKTGEKVIVPPHLATSFKVASQIKSELNPEIIKSAQKAAAAKSSAAATSAKKSA